MLPYVPISQFLMGLTLACFFNNRALNIFTETILLKIMRHFTYKYEFIREIENKAANGNNYILSIPCKCSVVLSNEVLCSSRVSRVNSLS